LYPFRDIILPFKRLAFGQVVVINYIDNLTHILSRTIEFSPTRHEEYAGQEVALGAVKEPMKENRVADRGLLLAKA
jgi:hypothetical protein